MGNIKTIVIGIDGDNRFAYSSLRSACKSLGWNYNTVKSKWDDGIIKHDGMKLYKLNIIR